MENEQQKPLTQAEVDAILAHWPADFSGRLLVGIELSHNRSLECSNFRGTVFRDCHISHCKFDSSDFTGADFGDSVFFRCKMEYCKFNDADQEDATFDRCARFGSTGIDGDTRRQSEVVFESMMGMLRGVDVVQEAGWRRFAYEHTGQNMFDYDKMLRQLEVRFHEIDHAYPGMGAEIFNSRLFFLPQDLCGAANFIAQGNTVRMAYQLEAQGAFTGEEPLPEHEMFVLPHSDVQNNLLAERAFVARVKVIRGLDFGKLNDWLGLARDLSEVDDGVYDHAHYRQLLEEYGGAFEQIHQDDAGVAAAMFNYPAGYPPQEMRTAAEWVGNGATPKEAYEAFQGQMELAGIHHKHTLWLQGHPNGARADFTGRELKNLSFSGMDFLNASFTNARLYNCWMNEASFVLCDFNGAALVDISAVGADFDSANFCGATLESSIFQDAYLGGASFVGATLTSCGFQGADMEDVDFSQASVQGCVGLEGQSSGQNQSM